MKLTLGIKLNGLRIVASLEGIVAFVLEGLGLLGVGQDRARRSDPMGRRWGHDLVGRSAVGSRLHTIGGGSIEGVCA